MKKNTQNHINNNSSSGLLSLIVQRGFWLLFVSATLFAITAQQKPYPDAFLR